jgi:hypothetical protein
VHAGWQIERLRAWGGAWGFWLLHHLSHFNMRDLQGGSGGRSIRRNSARFRDLTLTQAQVCEPQRSSRQEKRPWRCERILAADPYICRW